MSEEIVKTDNTVTLKVVRYDKARDGLIAGLDKLVQEYGVLDLNQEGVEGLIGKMTVAAQNAIDVAKDRFKKEAVVYTVPLAAVEQRWKPLIKSFDQMFNSLKVSASEVLRRKRDAQEKVRAEAEAKLEAARAAERATRENLQQQETEAVVRHDALVDLRRAKAAVEALPPAGAPIGIRTPQGTLFGTSAYTWELQDLTLVPEEFLSSVVNKAAVDKAVKDGVRTIAGIRIFPDTSMTSRRKR